MKGILRVACMATAPAWLTLAAAGASAAEANQAAVRDKSGVVEEIVVTSRRQEESVQEVPVSVTVFGAEQIEQIKPTTLRDFDGLAPNVYIGMNTAGPGASAIYIRGVGYADIEKTQSPQVGVIVDGIQMGSSTGQLIDVFDVESIEVNRGPQGVLFGKNTIGGNIVVNRVRPQFNDFGVNVAVESGNYDSTIYKARVNLPLIDDMMALKIGFIDRQRDGYYKNITLGGTAGDVDFSAQTAALRLAPTEDFEATLTYDRIDDTSQTLPQDPRFNGDNPFQNLADKREPSEYNVDQLGLQARWDIGDYVLNSITGYHDGRDKVNQDFDGGSIAGVAIPFAQLHTLRDQTLTVFTEELRLSGAITETLDFQVGGYYYESRQKFSQRTNNVLQLPPVAIAAPFAGLTCAQINGAIGTNLRPNPSVGSALCQFPNARSVQRAGEDVKSYAAFGALTFRPMEDVELSVGARYIDEEKDFRNAYTDFTDNTFDTTPVNQEFDFTGRPARPGTRIKANDSWSDTIFTASANWAITDSNRAYLTYAEGFRSGGFSIRSARTPEEAAFDPETAYQVELGLKNEFFDNRLRANLAFFYLRREDSQFSSIITLPPGSIPGTTTLINNGGKSDYQGIELETQWVITDELSLIANGGWLDVDNKKFSIACEFLDGCATGVPGVTDPLGTPRQLGGNSDSRQPEWNYSGRLVFTREMGEGEFAANVGYKRVGKFLLVNTGGGANQRLFEGPYGLLEAAASYTWRLSGDDRLSLSLVGKNLTDENYKEQALFLGGPNTGFQGWGAPQTFAVELLYSH